MPTPRFSIRVDPAELKRWKKAAKAEGLDVSAWIRSRCNVTAAKRTKGLASMTAPPPAGACPPHPKGARQAVNAELGLFRCGACGEIAP